MGKNDTLYNIVSIMFVLLSVMVCLITIAWSTGTINVPSALAPSTDVPIPPTVPRYTFTPSLTPQATRTPLPTDAPRATWTPTTDPDSLVATSEVTAEAGD